MMNRSKAALLTMALSVFLPAAAHASFLAGTTLTTAGGPSVFPGNASGSAAGTLLASNAAPYSFLTTGGTTSGTLTSAVFQNPTGTLDFYYQVANSGSSASSIARESNTSFTGFATQTGYRTDGSGLAGVLFQNGSVLPVTADSTGNVVGFSFTPPSTAKIAPGSVSSVLVISTNATAFVLGNAAVIDGGTQTVSAFQPSGAVPEPVSMLLMGTGLLALAGVRRFKKSA
ncbi:MAG: PEP-CTERM sorting domain-containing protein [Bryobacteraceae bacterium]